MKELVNGIPVTYCESVNRITGVRGTSCSFDYNDRRVYLKTTETGPDAIRKLRQGVERLYSRERSLIVV